jgi:Domain of unknown function (DUF1772)
MLTLLVANLTVTSAMFGVIWVIQLVHYPMFAELNAAALPRWHAYHSSRISYLVAPLMVGELALSVGFSWMAPKPASFIALGLTVGVWLATFFLSVPLHESLARVELNKAQSADELIRKLVVTNWPRSILYTAKVILLIWIFLQTSP